MIRMRLFKPTYAVAILTTLALVSGTVAFASSSTAEASAAGADVSSVGGCTVSNVAQALNATDPTQLAEMDQLSVVALGS